MKFTSKKAFIEYLTTKGKKFRVMTYNHKGSVTTFESVVTGFEYSRVAHHLYFENGETVILPILKKQFHVGSNGIVCLDHYCTHYELTEIN